MTTTALSVRAAAKRQIRDLLAAEAPARLDGKPVPVLVGPDGRNIEDVVYIIGRVEGLSYEVPAFTGPTERLWRDDVFRVEVLCIATCPSDLDQLESDDRAVALFDVLDGIVADDPSLDELAGVQWAVMGVPEGPDPVPGDAQVWTSQVRAWVEVHARSI